MTDESDFTVCPHCWQLNPPTRICSRCLADVTTVLQESGGHRWTAPVQSPVPVRMRRRLPRWQRMVLAGALLLYGLVQLATTFGGRYPGAAFQLPAASDQLPE